jgi:signal transduction histidine kinase
MFNMNSKTPFKDSQPDPSALLLLEAAGALISIELTCDGTTANLCKNLFPFLKWSETPSEELNIFDWIDKDYRENFEDFIANTLKQPEPQVFELNFLGIDVKKFPSTPCFVLALPLNVVTEPFIKEVGDELILSKRKTSPDSLRLYIIPKKEKEELLSEEMEDDNDILSAGAAHDLNNLFHNTLSVAEMLQSQIDDPSLQRYVELIRKSIDHAVDITGDLMSNAPGHGITSNPIEAIHELISLLARNLGSGIQLTLSFPKEEYSLKLKASHLSQIVLNLILNAKEAVGGEGQIIIAGSYIPANNPTELMLIVQDNGDGIDPEYQEHIFDPFFSTKVEEGGTGLGLSIVHSLAEQAGGSVEVISAVGEGSRFTVKIPLNLQ